MSAAVRSCSGRPWCSANKSLDLGHGLVHRRGDDVRWGLTGQLHDVFTEIGLDRFDAGCAQRFVELGFLGEHRLRLDCLADSVAPGDVDYMAAYLGAVARPQDLGAAGTGPLFENLQPDIEVVDNATANRFAGSTQFGEVEAVVGEAGDSLGTLADEQRLGLFQRFLQALVAHLHRSSRREEHRLRMAGCAHFGNVPASTSARCSTWVR